MPLSVLITQCMQRDFVDLLRPHDPLPNRLHVGYSEALRLLGPDPLAGPVAQTMNWARAQPPEALEIIHIRDWHDKNDPRQREHLERFGEHCLCNTPGASFIFDVEQPSEKRAETVFDSILLSDFENTTLRETISVLKRNAGKGGLRVGVIGVWTEAKVSFLLYDLKTRCGIDELATCSALTASASRAQHFNALEQLNRILGVNCFDSVAEFVAWLSPGSALKLPSSHTKFGHKITVNGGTLSENDRDIVGYLYRDSSAVVLDPLSGGFSGNAVFRALSRDSLGHQQAPSVVKLGSNKAIGAERVAFERIEEILGNNAPSVRGFADLGQRAGIKYSYAGMGQGKVRTFKSLYESGCTQEKIDEYLRTAFEDILGPLYDAAKYERLPLLDHYRFSPQYASHVRQNVQRVIDGSNGSVRESGEQLVFPGNVTVDSVCKFYESFLAAQPPNSGEYHYVSYVHGDLNGANILIDGRENVWVIDFFHTGPGHVLKDLAKLESDLLYIFTPVIDTAELEEAMRLTQALAQVADLRTPLPDSVPGLSAPAFIRAWRTLHTLRQIAARLCRDDRNPLQMSIALLRYAAHTLSFDESSALQKQWALYAASVFGSQVSRIMGAEQKLRTDWVPLPPSALAKTPANSGRLGITICPGRRDRGRDLRMDLACLKSDNVAHLYCFMTEAELEWAGTRPSIFDESQAHSIQFHHAPMPDGDTPGIEDARKITGEICAALDRGENVVLHCMGGLGRSGTLAACVLIDKGLSSEQAIVAVRQARGPRAIETKVQESFLAEFAERRRQTNISKRVGE